MPKTDILSPHYDDAVLSAWHQIEGPNTRVITVFGGSPENNKTGFWDKNSTQMNGADTIKLRQAENQDALKNTTTSALNLSFLEIQYALFGKRNLIEIMDTIEEVVTKNAAIIAAAGLGRFLKFHMDHIDTRKVALGLLDRGHDVSFYADIPYMLPKNDFDHWPEKISVEKAQRILGVPLTIEPYELSSEQKMRKQLAVQAFSSQIPSINKSFNNALDNPETYRWEAIIKPK